MNKKQINSQFLLSLGAIAFLAFSSFLVLEVVNQKQQGLGRIINLAGRQRMLSQRITLLAFEAQNGGEKKSLPEDLELFKKSHEEIIQAIPKSSLFFDVKTLSHHYEKLGPLMANFLIKVNEMKTDSSPKKLEELSIFAKGELLQELDTAVKLFEEYSEAINSTLRWIIFLLIFLILLSLVVIYKAILSPLRETILENQVQLEKREKHALDEAHFKSMFLANMSHELRTPLNGVLGTADLLNSTNLDPEQRKFLKTINDSGESLLGVINNILDLTKLETKEVRLENIPFSPPEVLNSLKGTFNYLLNEKKVDLLLESSNLPEFLSGDKLRFKQIINNLVSNAIKFTTEGKVIVHMTYEDGLLHLSVIDEGLGISEEHLEKLFTPFRQADISTTRKFGGSGLGLSIVKEIVELMGGTIRCESKIGSGTLFNVVLPFAVSETGPKVTSEEIKTISGKGRVLVVDDNQINLDLMIKVLERLEIVAVGALGGREALRKVEEQEFDLIFMDYHMPDLDGIETTLELRKLPHGRTVPVIALTADIQDSTKKHIMDAGMVMLLSKPVRRKELLTVLQDFLY